MLFSAAATALVATATFGEPVRTQVQVAQAPQKPAQNVVDAQNNPNLRFLRNRVFCGMTPPVAGCEQMQLPSP
jgi:hypothetical protein